MLEPIRHTLDFQRIILASTSPRRSEILRRLGIHFEILPSLFEENLDPKKFPSPADYAVETAYQKVLDVANRVANDINKADVIIGADTVVTLDGKLYGKPKDSAEAHKFLQELSGRQHTVYTGVVIKTPDATVKFSEKTLVSMAYLNEDVIQGYIRTREPMDKAGAYGIQGHGGTLIEKIQGDFYTVLGLPLHSFCKHLLWLYDDKRKNEELKRTLGSYDGECRSDSGSPTMKSTSLNTMCGLRWVFNDEEIASMAVVSPSSAKEEDSDLNFEEDDEDMEGTD